MERHKTKIVTGPTFTGFKQAFKVCVYERANIPQPGTMVRQNDR